MAYICLMSLSLFLVNKIVYVYILKMKRSILSCASCYLSFIDTPDSLNQAAMVLFLILHLWVAQVCSSFLPYHQLGLVFMVQTKLFILELFPIICKYLVATDRFFVNVSGVSRYHHKTRQKGKENHGLLIPYSCFVFCFQILRWRDFAPKISWSSSVSPLSWPW